jgi:DNA-binding NtrC family response regulator
VYGIIKEHRGWITVSSKVGKGSIFKIYLPASYEKVCFFPKVSQTSSCVIEGNGERILFVEDDKAICRLMEKRLSEKGYTVFTAEDGITTLDIFKKEKYNIDLLLIDTVLPDKQGIELVDLLLSYNPKLKVLLTSEYLDNAAEWEIKKERHLRFIEKPYTLVELLREIKECLVKKN